MNALIFVVLLGINLWQFFAVPLLPAAWAWTLIPLAFTSNTLWAAIHEAVHGHLFHSPRVNRIGGQILSCVFGSAFSFLCAGHLTHHALNRTEEQLEVLKPGESIWVARLRYYFFLCGGLYLAEMMVPVAFLWPYLNVKPKDRFMESVFVRSLRRRRALVGETLCVLTLLSVSAWLYGSRWYLLAGVLGARALFISSLDYIYHYGNALGDSNAAYNLSLPRPLEALILRFNLHHAHHASPKTPWYELPEPPAHEDSYWRAALRVWRGPR